MLLGVPVLVSRETHFSELINQHEGGVGLLDSDDPEMVADGLLRVADPELKSTFRAGTGKVVEVLNWRAVSGRFFDEIQRHDRS